MLCKRGVAAVVWFLLQAGWTWLHHRDARPVIVGIFGQAVVVC